LINPYNRGVEGFDLSLYVFCFLAFTIWAGANCDIKQASKQASNAIKLGRPYNRVLRATLYCMRSTAVEKKNLVARSRSVTYENIALTLSSKL